MSTWAGVVVATAGRASFWAIAARHGVVAAGSVDGENPAAVPARVLVACHVGVDAEAPLRLAAALSRELDDMALGFVAQTTADVYLVEQYVGGETVRELAFDRDAGGFVTAAGAVQAWEAAMLFDGAASLDPDVERWPDTLLDELTEAQVARYEAARSAGDASAVMDLVQLSSTAPIARMLTSLGVDPDAPNGTWRAPSLWQRLRARLRSPPR